jgi:hypothetical protein
LVPCAAERPKSQLPAILEDAIEVVPFSDYADPRHVVPLAQAAGWEGIFV